MQLLFDYESLEQEELLQIAQQLPRKILRWLVAHHPDNRTRIQFLRLTGIDPGQGTVINAGFVVSDDYEPLLTIGERVAISPNVTVICASSPNNSMLAKLPGFEHSYCRKEKVVIGDDSWIGAGAIILPGVTIGDHCVIGAGSVVSKSMPSRSVSKGVPARPTKSIGES